MMIRRVVVIACLGLLPVLLPHSQSIAQEVGDSSLTLLDKQQEISRTQYAAAATTAALQRQSNRQLRRQQLEIDELQFDIDDLRTRVATGEADRSALVELREELTAQQDQFVAELTERDQVYAEEIQRYRAALEDIAATPEGLKALERYNAGEEAEALAILDRLRAAQDLAAARRIAQLAFDARERGKVSTDSVIARFEEITTLDPEVFWDWVTLTRLYRDLGDLEKSLIAAMRAEETAAPSDLDLKIASNEIGDVLVARGERAAALEQYERGLEFAERLVALDPAYASWQRDLSVSLIKTADVLVAQGERAAALERYERGLAIRERLAASDPANASWQRDVSVSLAKVSDVLIAQGEKTRAMSLLKRGLKITEQLLSIDSGHVTWANYKAWFTRQIAKLELESQ